MDREGNIYVGQFGDYVVKQVLPSGTNWSGIDFGRADGAMYSGVAAAPSGDLFGADQAKNRLVHLVKSGTNWTPNFVVGLWDSDAAETPPRTLAFNGPGGLTVDARTNVFVAETGGVISRVSRVGTNWVKSILGGVDQTFKSRDGIGTNALFNLPNGIAVDVRGNLFVADYLGYAVRMGRPLPPEPSVTRSRGAAIRIAWPDPWGRFRLEASTVIGPGEVWAPVDGVAASEGGFEAMVEPDGVGRFYRIVDADP